MIYKKPHNVRYTDMCIYIDTHHENYEEYLVFQYIYLLVEMLAKKSRYFEYQKMYEDFAIYASTRVFNRWTNTKLEPIKSILNFLHKMMYPYYCDFLKDPLYVIQPRPEIEDKDTYGFNNVLTRSVSDLNICDFNVTMQNVDKTCKKFLSTIPYPKDSSMWLNIYTSVMLTFLNSCTLPNDVLEYKRERESKLMLSDKQFMFMYDQQRASDPILFHLPQQYSNYVSVLARQLKHILAKDLQEILHTKVEEDYFLYTAIKSEVLPTKDDNT